MTEPTATPKAKPKAIDWDVFEFFPVAKPNKTPIAEPMAIPDPTFPVLLAFILQRYYLQFLAVRGRIILLVQSSAKRPIIIAVLE
jgi:hypothetical protein